MFEDFLVHDILVYTILLKDDEIFIKNMFVSIFGVPYFALIDRYALYRWHHLIIWLVWGGYSSHFPFFWENILIISYGLYFYSLAEISVTFCDKIFVGRLSRPSLHTSEDIGWHFTRYWFGLSNLKHFLQQILNLIIRQVWFLAYSFFSSFLLTI